nr:MAG TPA: hypothetical protein [Microviridae sp.]
MVRTGSIPLDNISATDMLTIEVANDTLAL